MNSDKNLYAALNDHVVMVNVRFPAGTQDYTYKGLKEDELKKDDVVVVPVTRNGEDQLAIVKVTSVDSNKNFNDDIGYKWVVQRVDTARWEELNRREEKFQQAVLDMERQKKREEIKAQLETRIGRKAALQLTKDLM